MKLAAEDKLKPFPETFFDVNVEHNYFAQNVSPYIKEVLEKGKLANGASWADYAAGYMWGTTGFVFNPEKIDRSIMTSWNCLTSKACERKITAKDNVRDSYFMGLGMYYEQELLALKEKYENKQISKEEYTSVLSSKMNDTSVDTIGKVKKCLENMRKNLYGLETDEGKLEVISGRLDASFQWSGDGVYIIDEAESNDLYLEYSIPESASNLWFDGWVMMKDANEHAATAFVNFLSMQENVIRNMYYIGYTSCIAGEQVFEYINDTYSDEEGNEIYDLSYFFGEGHSFKTTTEQTRRQLFAQYPRPNVIDRLIVMNYFDSDSNERVNRMWNNIK
jgi:spermidine/putrescine transport system substrate-binding protein